MSGIYTLCVSWFWSLEIPKSMVLASSRYPPTPLQHSRWRSRKGVCGNEESRDQRGQICSFITMLPLRDLTQSFRNGLITSECSNLTTKSLPTVPHLWTSAHWEQSFWSWWNPCWGTVGTEAALSRWVRIYTVLFTQFLLMEEYPVWGRGSGLASLPRTSVSLTLPQEQFSTGEIEGLALSVPSLS